jgi:hypothetical protein
VGADEWTVAQHVPLRVRKHRFLLREGLQREAPTPERGKETGACAPSALP